MTQRSRAPSPPREGLSDRPPAGTRTATQHTRRSPAMRCPRIGSCHGSRRRGARADSWSTDSRYRWAPMQRLPDPSRFIAVRMPPGTAAWLPRRRSRSRGDAVAARGADGRYAGCHGLRAGIHRAAQAPVAAGEQDRSATRRNPGVRIGVRGRTLTTRATPGRTGPGDRPAKHVGRGCPPLGAGLP